MARVQADAIAKAQVDVQGQAAESARASVDLDGLDEEIIDL